MTVIRFLGTEQSGSTKTVDRIYNTLERCPIVAEVEYPFEVDGRVEGSNTKSKNG